MLSLDVGSGCTITFAVHGDTATLSPGDQACTSPGAVTGARQITTWSMDTFTLEADGGMAASFVSTASTQFENGGVAIFTCTVYGTNGFVRPAPPAPPPCFDGGVPLFGAE
jgi:hypothetical protein